MRALFHNKLKKLQHQALGKRRRFVWIFDRGFADVKLMIKLKKWRVGFIIRVCRNVGIQVEGDVGKLGQFQAPGYLENIVYHKDKRIRVHSVRPAQPAADRRVFTISQGKPLLRLGRKLHPDRRFFNSDNHMLLVSNQACNLLQLYSQRMKIEEAFRDLFGRCSGIELP